MTVHCHPLPSWSTAAFDNAADTSPMELSALSQHVRQCSRRGGAWSALVGSVSDLHRGLLARFVTSLALLAMLVGAAAMVV